jgi:AraC-like DNA-binding protein
MNSFARSLLTSTPSSCAAWNLAGLYPQAVRRRGAVIFRLRAARRTLSDHRFRDHTIGAIAFDAGFGDLSYFNRAFGRRFGASPDIRAQARRSWEEGEES